MTAEMTRTRRALRFTLDVLAYPLLAVWYDRNATTASLLAGLAVMLPVRYTVGWPSLTVEATASCLAGLVAYGAVSVIEGRRTR